MNENASGWEMKSVSGWSETVKPSGVEVGGPDREREQRSGRDPDREADRERPQRAPGDVGPALDERDAEAGDRPELGADDHRADDQDRRVEEDPDRGDQAGERHEGEEDGVELDVLGGPRLDLLPDHRVAGAALGGAARPRRRPPRSPSRCARSRSSPRCRRRARAGRRRSRSRPRARRRRGSRRPPACARRARGRSRCRPTCECSSRSRTCSDWYAGTTIRMWTMRRVA